MTQPVMPATVVVTMDGWHVDDGDPEVKVGQVWEPTIELQRAGAATADDWWPRVTAAAPDSRPALVAVDAHPQPVYDFIAEAVATEADDVGEWTALRVGWLRFAVPGTHVGLVAGRGRLVYDTYMVSGDAVEAAARPRLVVSRIQRLGRRHGRSGDVFVLEPPVDVPGTRVRWPAEGPGEVVAFLVHCGPAAPATRP